MSRDDGFGTADIDTGYFDDPKVRTLVRSLLRDHPDRVAPALLLHLALLLGSWGDGHRITADEAMPLWWSDDITDLTEALRAAGLVDDEGRIPAHAWEANFGPAHRRRETARTAGLKGNELRWRRDSRPDSGPDSPPDSGPESPPDSPTVPTVPTDRTVHRARDGQAAGLQWQPPPAPKANGLSATCAIDPHHETLFTDGQVWCMTCNEPLA